MKKKLKIIVLLTFIIPVVLVFISNYLIEKNAENKTFSNLSKIKKNKVGLVLGTTKILKNGRINLYFRYRVLAAVELYKKGKIDFILVSGDNGNKNYDEPTDFKNELIKKAFLPIKFF